MIDKNKQSMESIRVCETCDSHGNYYIESLISDDLILVECEDCIKEKKSNV